MNETPLQLDLFTYAIYYNYLANKFKDGDTFVEVGTWFGKSTNYLVNKIKESKKDIKFVTVDTFKGTDDEQLHQTIVNSFTGDIFYEFIDNTVLFSSVKYFFQFFPFSYKFHLVFKRN